MEAKTFIFLRGVPAPGHSSKRIYSQAALQLEGAREEDTVASCKDPHKQRKKSIMSPLEGHSLVLTWATSSKPVSIWKQVGIKKTELEKKGGALREGG